MGDWSSIHGNQQYINIYILYIYTRYLHIYIYNPGNSGSTVLVNTSRLIPSKQLHHGLKEWKLMVTSGGGYVAGWEPWIYRKNWIPSKFSSKHPNLMGLFWRNPTLVSAPHHQSLVHGTSTAEDRMQMLLVTERTWEHFQTSSGGWFQPLPKKYEKTSDIIIPFFSAGRQRKHQPVILVQNHQWNDGQMPYLLT